MACPFGFVHTHQKRTQSHVRSAVFSVYRSPVCRALVSLSLHVKISNMASFTFTMQLPTPTTSAVTAAYSDILQHPERYYQGSDIVWVMISSALVFIMIPSLSLIYAGLGNRSFALTLFRLPLMTAAFIGLQWVLWGYTLTFTDSLLWWGGESRANALQDVLARPISTGDGPGGPPIPELVYVLYEGMFAAFTAALVCGGTMHRARPARFIIFITFWSLLIYYPVARWSWSSYGWSKGYGVMDFAGGTPVHIVSGTTVAAFAVFCSFESKKKGEFLPAVSERFRKRWSLFRETSSRRFQIVYRALRASLMLCTCGCIRLPSLDKEDRGKGPDPTPATAASPPGAPAPPANGHPANSQATTQPVFQPYNVNYLVFGTALLWFGWAGFNGGSALGGNLRAVSAWTSTHIAACAGGVTGMFWIWWLKTKPDTNSASTETPTFDHLSVFYFCDGAISGLVAITPAAGYVPVWSAVIFGVVSALFVNFLKGETEIFLRNDPLQVFAVHTGGGFVGMALTGLLADPVTIGLDGHSTIPHPEYSKGQRLGYQLLDGFMGMGYTFLVALAILFAMKLVASWFMEGPSAEDLENRFSLEDGLQAAISQHWRNELDTLGRPRASSGTAPQEASPPEPAIPMNHLSPPNGGAWSGSPSPQLPPVAVGPHGTL
ncbi:ammonium transporter AmtB-like domain-containing protein [Apodospora peruviana]|uniref:Ammonium transporter AmtB-like domain-containing protein n=1 Tax=Apodospora peruviana TaxID=516989 RepID=A0AAE0IQD5_9PEZI|nr:ammonium transporter AmtB-like domain-containing protein [Apodospora peruviana]